MLARQCSLLDPPGFAWRALRTCWLVLRLRCPSCGLGRMSAAFLALNERCQACGVVFERDPGEVTGGIFVNSMATTLGICLLAGWLAFYGPVPLRWTTPVCIAFAVVFPVLFYRHSRAIWIGLLHLCGLVHRDEAADPEPRPRPWPSAGPGGGGPPAVPDRQTAPQVAVVGTGRPPDPVS